MIRSLRFRLALGAVVAIGLSLAIVWVTLSRVFTDYVVNQYLTEMTVLSDSLAASAKISEGRVVLTATPSDPRLSLPAGGRYWALEENDTILERSRSLWDTTVSESSMTPSAYGPFLEATGPDGQTMLLLSQDSILGDGPESRSFCIYTAFPKAELEGALMGFHSELLRMLLVTAGLLALAATAQSVVGLAPLDRLRQKVTDIRSGLLARMTDEGPAEVRPLIHEIDLLLQEREEAIERARSRASDLAHGLKTPLTVISQLAESMEPGAAEMTLRQVDLIRQRADRQLQAARLGVERMLSTDIGELAGKLIQVLKPARDDATLDWKLEVKGDVRVEADPADLAEAIGNILDNAAKWARSEIAVKIERQDGEVVATIADDGPGIPLRDHAAALQRGIHAGNANGGSGLGLAITADIAEAYGATLALGEAATGGLEIALRFPVKTTRRAKVPA
ncbi:MAG: HAMP domain-containing histidine kinase [Rhizobium sp.]|nr:HAMP domain-containing histidine kinase [Rhizobium sp.]